MTEYRKPDISLLQATDTAQLEIQQTAQRLIQSLAAYGFPGKIAEIQPGPIVTTYHFKPNAGVSTNNLWNLSQDIARELAVKSVRITYTSGSDNIAIEISNSHPTTVQLGPLLADPRFTDSQHKIPLAMGVFANGEPAYYDLDKMPHMLVCGRTGSGKSVFLQSIIMSLVYRFTPDECKLMLIDPKGVDFEFWDDIPHLITPTIKLDAYMSINALKWVLSEIEKRYWILTAAKERTIETYNESAETRMPYLVIIIDEFADLSLVSKHEFESCIQYIVQKARTVGIHLILATQRPDAHTITDVIDTNFPTRISFNARNAQDSVVTLGESGAQDLLPCGDMLFSAAGRPPKRIHAAFVSDAEINAVADHLNQQGKPQYEDGVTDDNNSIVSSDMDKLYARAVEIVVAENKPTISYIQRRLLIGYNKAATLMERMEAAGIVTAPDADGKRKLIEK